MTITVNAQVSTVLVRVGMVPFHVDILHRNAATALIWTLKCLPRRLKGLLGELRFGIGLLSQLQKLQNLTTNLSPEHFLNGDGGSKISSGFSAILIGMCTHLPGGRGR